MSFNRNRLPYQYSIEQYEILKGKARVFQNLISQLPELPRSEQPTRGPEYRFQDFVQGGVLTDAVSLEESLIDLTAQYEHFPRFLFLCGMLHEKLKEQDDALVIYQEMVNKFPQYYQASLAVGKILLEKREYNESIRFVNKVIWADRSVHSTWRPTSDQLNEAESYLREARRRLDWQKIHGELPSQQDFFLRGHSKQANPFEVLSNLSDESILAAPTPAKILAKQAGLFAERKSYGVVAGSPLGSRPPEAAPTVVRHGR